jgi:hypothetical protein
MEYLEQSFISPHGCMSTRNERAQEMVSDMQPFEWRFSF